MYSRQHSPPTDPHLLPRRVYIPWVANRGSCLLLGGPGTMQCWVEGGSEEQQPRGGYLEPICRHCQCGHCAHHPHHHHFCRPAQHITTFIRQSQIEVCLRSALSFLHHSSPMIDIDSSTLILCIATNTDRDSLCQLPTSMPEWQSPLCIKRKWSRMSSIMHDALHLKKKFYPLRKHYFLV